ARRPGRADVERRLRRHPPEAPAGVERVNGAFRIVSASDSAVIVEFDARIDVAINARAIAVAESVQSAAIPGVRDVVPTYCSVAIYFDPLRTNYDSLRAHVEQDPAQMPQTHRTIS